MLLRRHTRPFLPLSCLALFLLLGAPASAEEAAAAGPRLGLGLDASQVFEGLDPEAASGDAQGASDGLEGSGFLRESAEPVTISSLSPSPELWREEALTQEVEERVAPPKKGFKRWLKRRWYIPVLVAVAVGVVVSDDGSDGPDDLEDDD